MNGLRFNFWAEAGTGSEAQALLEKQLADAQKEAQNALAEWRSYPNAHYEQVWLEAVDKVRRLEARIPKRKAASRGA